MDDYYHSQNKISDLKRELQEAMSRIKQLEIANDALWQGYQELEQKESMANKWNQEHRKEAIIMRFERDSARRRADRAERRNQDLINDRNNLLNIIHNLEEENEEVTGRYLNMLNQNHNNN